MNQCERLGCQAEAEVELTRDWLGIEYVTYHVCKPCRRVLNTEWRKEWQEHG